MCACLAWSGHCCDRLYKHHSDHHQQDNSSGLSFSSASPWRALAIIRLLPFSVFVWEFLAGPGRFATCAPYPPSQPGRSSRLLEFFPCAQVLRFLGMYVLGISELSGIRNRSPRPTMRALVAHLLPSLEKIANHTNIVSTSQKEIAVEQSRAGPDSTQSTKKCQNTPSLSLSL